MFFYGAERYAQPRRNFRLRQPLKPAKTKNSLRPFRQIQQLADNPLNLLLVNRALFSARIVAGKVGHLIIAERHGLPPLLLAVMIEQQIPRRTEQIGFTVLNFSLWIMFGEAGKTLLHQIVSQLRIVQLAFQIRQQRLGMTLKQHLQLNIGH